MLINGKRKATTKLNVTTRCFIKHTRNITEMLVTVADALNISTPEVGKFFVQWRLAWSYPDPGQSETHSEKNSTSKNMDV